MELVLRIRLLLARARKEEEGKRRREDVLFYERKEASGIER